MIEGSLRLRLILRASAGVGLRSNGHVVIVLPANYHPAMEGVAATSLVTAASRARESARPDALFIDPWADLLAGEKGREFLQTHEDLLPATTPIFVVRHRFFDDFLVGVAGRGLQQIVLVAAGLDTRAYRLVWPAGTHVYEMDQPQVLAYKQEILNRAGAAPACTRVPVAADLREDWPAILRAAGFRPDVPTVWLAEGLLFYLPEAAARALLTTMASLSAPASVLGTDTMSATMLASEERRAWVQLYADSGAPFVFGTDNPGGFVSSCGWNPVVHLGRDLGSGYGRPYPEPQQLGPPPGAVITATLA
jgi:methyltransferase (TIGR00027 family)